MPGNLPTELQSNTRDWFSSNDKDLRDAIKSVVSRYGFALNTLALDSTSTGTLDLRYNVFIGNTTVGNITMSLPTATTWGDRKTPFLTIINEAGSNNIIINAALGDTIVGYTTATSLTILPGECWEFFPDYRGFIWNAFRKQTEGYKEGTWTPGITFTTPGDLAITASVAVGDYMRIGAWVVASWRYNSSAFTFTTASGNLTVTGLPYVANSATNFVWPGPVTWGGITKAGFTNLTCEMVFGSSVGVLTASGSGVAPANITAADTPSGGTLRFRGIFIYRA
jgi:hypothetical protein